MTDHKRELATILGDEFEATLAGIGIAKVGNGKPVWRSRDGHQQFHVLWDSKAQDPLRGHAFTLEFVSSASRTVPANACGGPRLLSLADPLQQGALATQWNRYAARLSRPSDGQILALMGDPALAERYRAHFQPVTDIATREFLWYRDRTDMEGWARTIAPMLPLVVQRAARVTTADWLAGRYRQWHAGSVEPADRAMIDAPGNNPVA